MSESDAHKAGYRAAKMEQATELTEFPEKARRAEKGTKSVKAA